MMLPSVIREFVEGGPSDVFLLGSRITEAARSREVLDEIYRLSEKHCEACASDCETCFVGSARIIMVESGLT